MEDIHLPTQNKVHRRCPRRPPQPFPSGMVDPYTTKVACALRRLTDRLKGQISTDDGGGGKEGHRQP